MIILAWKSTGLQALKNGDKWPSTNFTPNEDRRNVFTFAAPKNVPLKNKLDPNQDVTASAKLNGSTKPVSLLRYFIQKFSNPGDVVLDMLAGLGSASEAAILENRHAVAVEKYSNQVK